MKLIGTLTSPFVRKVRVVLAEKKIDCDFVIDSPWEDDNRITDFNPLAKIPVLVLDDESSLFDSRVIVDYLDNLVPNAKLIPVTNRERAEVKRWEALADGVNEAAVAIVLEHRRTVRTQNKKWINRQTQKIENGLRFMATELGESEWCNGSAISMADIAMGCMLSYLDFRFPQKEWVAPYANLNTLCTKLAQRPSFSGTVPQE